MNELATEEMESSTDPIRQKASGRPLQTMHTQRTVLDADDELVFPKHKRVVTQYSTDASGAAELHLYYGENEISFDEPGLFAFGKSKQSRFVARTAATSGNGYDWPRVQTLPEQPISADSIEARATPLAQQRRERCASRNRPLWDIFGTVTSRNGAVAAGVGRRDERERPGWKCRREEDSGRRRGDARSLGGLAGVGLTCNGRRQGPHAAHGSSRRTSAGVAATRSQSPAAHITAQSAVSYHATMRWTFPIVLLAAWAGAPARPTTALPAYDDASGLISQPEPGWKLEHWFDTEPVALRDLHGKVDRVESPIL